MTIDTTPDWVMECRSREPRREQLSRSILFDWEGQVWTAATNGHRLGAIRGACSDATPEAKLEPVAPRIAAVLKKPTDMSGRQRVAVAELREWFGSDQLNPDCEVCHGKGQWVCDACDGEGYVDCECSCGDEHERQCRECKGRASIVCGKCLPSTKIIDLGKMFGMVFNRSIIRAVIAKLPYEWCYFHPDGERATWFYDDSHAWLLLLMPMRPDVDRDKDLPVFTPGQQAAA